jgi:hypothetical protein
VPLSDGAVWKAALLSLFVMAALGVLVLVAITDVGNSIK